MFSVTKEVEFDAGHRVPNHNSKCRNPHGHRYRVRISVIGDLIDESGASDEGMVVDFSELKSYLVQYVHDVLDHSFIVYKDDLLMWHAFNAAFQQGGSDWRIVEFPYIPTAENIALWCFEQLEPHVRNLSGLKLDAITVWETPTSTATYLAED